MSRIKLNKRQYSRRQLRQKPSLYFDVGMPLVSEVATRYGYDSVVPSERRGNNAQDESHLYQARKEKRIFVTKDKKRLIKEATQGRLLNSPGIVCIHTASQDQEDIAAGLAIVLGLFKTPESFYEAGILITHGTLIIYDADGKARRPLS